MQISLKTMSETDFEKYREETIQDFARELIRIHPWSQSEALDEARKSFEKNIFGSLQSKTTQCFNILRDQEIIGYVTFSNKEVGSAKHAFIWDFKVFQNFRGYGIFAMLELRQYLKKIGCSKVALHVFANNNNALTLYEKVGFKINSYNMSLDL